MRVIIKAHEMIKDALPWLTRDMQLLVDRLKAGDYGPARSDLAQRFVDKYAGQVAAAKSAAETPADPRAEYTTGGCPINVGKYRACVGCECDDPCASGCECKCDCGCPTPSTTKSAV